MLEKVPPATLFITSISLVIPLIISSFPHLSKLIFFNPKFPFSIISAIFADNFTISTFTTCLMRAQLLFAIESRMNREIEIIFYTLTLIFPLLISNLLENLQSFNSSVNMAYICMLSTLQTEFDLFGVSVDHNLLPIIYMALDYVLNQGRTKAYYGFIYGFLYFKLVKIFNLRIPRRFIQFYRRIKNNLKKKPVFSGKVYRRIRD